MAIQSLWIGDRVLSKAIGLDWGNSQKSDKGVPSLMGVHRQCYGGVGCGSTLGGCGMAIDVFTRKVIPLREASQLLPKRPTGRKLGMATLYRWV